MECSVECFKHTYTHALVHVSTGDMHRMITVEGTRFVMVLSFTAGTAPRSTAGPGALGSKPGTRGAGFSTGVLLPTGLLPLPANCPSWVSPTAAAIGAELAKSCRSCSVLTRWQPALPSLGHRHSLRVFWSWDSDAGKALLKCLQCCLLRFQGSPGCSRCVDPSTSPGPASWDAAAARRALSSEHSVWEQGRAGPPVSTEQSTPSPAKWAAFNCWRIPQTVYSCGLFL